MCTNKNLIGNIVLNGKIDSLPSGEISVRKLRVELTEEQNPDSRWISELEILGELPWRVNEQRQVKVRIMSDEFRKHVEIALPNLQVTHGSSDLGILKFENGEHESLRAST